MVPENRSHGHPQPVWQQRMEQGQGGTPVRETFSPGWHKGGRDGVGCSGRSELPSLTLLQESSCSTWCAATPG